MNTTNLIRISTQLVNVDVKLAEVSKGKRKERRTVRDNLAKLLQDTDLQNRAVNLLLDEEIIEAVTNVGITRSIHMLKEMGEELPREHLTQFLSILATAWGDGLSMGIAVTEKEKF